MNDYCGYKEFLGRRNLLLHSSDTTSIDSEGNCYKELDYNGNDLMSIRLRPHVIVSHSLS